MGKTETTDFAYDDAMKKLEAVSPKPQTQVLRFFDELTEERRQALLSQIAATDFSIVDNISHAKNPATRGEFSPLFAMRLDEVAARKNEFRSRGIEALKQGKAAALLLAGGMGTRLGADAPKGTYDIGKTKPVYIFQRLVENLLANVADAIDKANPQSYPCLFIMTSEKNHEATVAFFNEKNFFGYPSARVHFFKQEMAPACDFSGKVYLEEKHRIATSPNGNAGWFLSLLRAGYGEILESEGIDWINVFAVDNVLQQILDPVFLGATIDKNASVGAKVVKKAAPDEKVGVICLEDGKPSIVEYYELSEEMMNAKDESGNPAYEYGVILNYLFRTDELQKIVEKSLPLHVVEKKIPYIDESGNAVKPDKPNGYKFEQLVLDMIHEMPSCLPFEVVREKEFAPIKNKTGVDSVESARKLCEENGILL